MALWHLWEFPGFADVESFISCRSCCKDLSNSVNGQQLLDFVGPEQLDNQLNLFDSLSCKGAFTVVPSDCTLSHTNSVWVGGALWDRCSVQCVVGCWGWSRGCWSIIYHWQIQTVIERSDRIENSNGDLNFFRREWGRRKELLRLISCLVSP